MSRASSSQQPSAAASKISLYNEGPSLEQSVRKFRIVEALRNDDRPAISKAIKESGDGGVRTSTSSTATQGGSLDDTTVLHLAIQCAEQPVVEYVLAEGKGVLDLNARDKDGNTPLHVAASQGRTQVVRLLLEQKEVNDSIANNAGRLPIDLARNPDIFEQLQLARSLFTERKVHQVQSLILQNDYKTLEAVLEDPRFQTVLDINDPEFASDPATVANGGTLLHDAARSKNSQLIQLLLLHGADPFRRDRKGKLPQHVTSDDVTKALLKKSPAAVAAQRGIQEKAVLGAASQPGGAGTAPGAAPGSTSDPLAGREAREMKGYLKKWTNYRKGYQLRWFVLEDGVLSYYKHQDDAGSACRGAINMKIARLQMMADSDKTKFEIMGKSSVKYTLKANHEVEAKRWFWALNNSIQWSKDQAKEEERQAARKGELLRSAREGGGGGSTAGSDSGSFVEGKRSLQIGRSRTHSANPSVSRAVGAGTSTAGSGDEDEVGGAAGSRMERVPTQEGVAAIAGDPDEEDDEDYNEEASSAGRETPAASKDAFNTTAQSARLQLDTMAQVNAALTSEASRNPDLNLSDPRASQALATYDAAIRSLSELVRDLLRISRDRDAYWQYRLDRESEMRRMWEESMAKVAREQEVLEARVGEAESKRRMTRRLLKEAVETGMLDEAGAREGGVGGEGDAVAWQGEDGKAASQVDLPPTSPVKQRRQTIVEQVKDMSESEEEDEEEFFDAVDAGQVEVSQLPKSELSPTSSKTMVTSEYDISSSFKGYENGIRDHLKIDADNRPKISLWVSDPSCNLCCRNSAPAATLTLITEHPQIYDRQGYDQNDPARNLQRANFPPLPLR
jgi:oxysterol-binding protein 1